MDGNKRRNYLVPYSDEEMLLDALIYYARQRHAFAQAISQKEYKNKAGRGATIDEINFALDAAKQADRLVGYAKEKVESPVIVLQ